MYENYILLVVIFAKCTVNAQYFSSKHSLHSQKHSKAQYAQSKASKHSLYYVYLYLITCFAIPFT
jgi:hypothetical protein